VSVIDLRASASSDDPRRPVAGLTIPERRDQVEHRRAKGSSGGRPPTFDPERYRERNTVERGFGRFKQWRIATRYDKYARTYLGGVLLAAIIILARQS
jgi:transposase